MFSFISGIFGASEAPTTTIAPVATTNPAEPTGNDQNSPPSTPRAAKPSPHFIRQKKQEFFGNQTDADQEIDDIGRDWEDLYSKSIPNPNQDIKNKAKSLQHFQFGKEPPKFKKSEPTTKDVPIMDEKPASSQTMPPPVAPPAPKKLATSAIDSTLHTLLLQRRKKMESGDATPATEKPLATPAKPKYKPPRTGPSLETVLNAKANLQSIVPKPRPKPLVIEEGEVILITDTQPLHSISPAEMAETATLHLSLIPSQYADASTPDSPYYFRYESDDHSPSAEPRSAGSSIDEEAEKKPFTLSEFCRYFTDAHTTLGDLKNGFKELRQASEEKDNSILFSHLVKYPLPVLDFTRMSDLTYIQTVAYEIATVFHRYVNYTLPQIKTCNAMLARHEIDTDDFEMAREKCVEFAEQLLRCCFAAIELLRKAKNFLHLDNEIQHAVSLSFNSMLDTLGDASDKLQETHENMLPFHTNKRETHDEVIQPLTPGSP